MALTGLVRPLAQHCSLCKPPALHYLPIDHEGAHCTKALTASSVSPSTDHHTRDLGRQNQSCALSVCHAYRGLKWVLPRDVSNVQGYLIWKGLTCTPDPSQEGVDEEDDGPPVAPEQVEAKVMCAVLRPKQQQSHERRVHIRCELEVDGLWPDVAAEEPLQQREWPQQIPPQPVQRL